MKFDDGQLVMLVGIPAHVQRLVAMGKKMLWMKRWTVGSTAKVINANAGEGPKGPYMTIEWDGGVRTDTYCSNWAPACNCD